MHPRRMLALVLLLAALGVLGYAFSVGQLNVALFLIFPVFYGTGFLPLLGMLLLFAAFIAWASSSFAGMRAGDYGDAYASDPPVRRYGSSGPETVDVGRGHEEEKPRRRVRGGGLVMIGPIPIVFGSDRGVVKGLLILGLILTVAAVLLMLVSFRGA